MSIINKSVYEEYMIDPGYYRDIKRIQDLATEEIILEYIEYNKLTLYIANGNLILDIQFTIDFGMNNGERIYEIIEYKGNVEGKIRFMEDLRHYSMSLTEEDFTNIERKLEDYK